jgi:hypothetical protein
MPSAFASGAAATLRCGCRVGWVSDTRHFLPWQVIKVSPSSLQRLLSPAGRAVIASEFWIVWLPAAFLCVSVWGARPLGDRGR